MLLAQCRLSLCCGPTEKLAVETAPTVAFAWGGALLLCCACMAVVAVGNRKARGRDRSYGGV